MDVAVAALGAVLAVAAAVRSTWSPCGQSMLSQITPVGEASRGARYGITASWFVAGALAGGLTLGAAAAVLAGAVALAGLSETATTALVAVLAVAAAAVDTGVLGVSPPFFLRQLNEDWLYRYRPWVYGSGFGWQVGAGVTTYIMTAAVFLTVAVAALGAAPWAALALCVLFALVRGLAVFLTARRRTTAELFALHRRFDALAEPVRRAVIGVQLGVTAVATALAFGVVAGAVVAVAAIVFDRLVVVRRRSRRPAPVSST